MKTRFESKKLGSWLLSGMLLCSLQLAMASPAQNHKRAVKKAPPPPPLPSGPTGPVQQIPLDSIAAVPPQVTYENNELTIVAPNSTLADILRAVKKLTGAEIDVPSAPERVVTRLGPGPARDVVADLLNGSRFNYVLLGSPDNLSALSRVVLVAKTGNQEIAPNQAPVAQMQAPVPQPQQQQIFGQPGDAQAEGNEVLDQPEESAAPEDNPDQNVNEADQQQQQDNPPQVKTPQQMLQEMQQRQMQLQQQQPPGQPPIPGSGMPPHPPQEP